MVNFPNANYIPAGVVYAPTMFNQSGGGDFAYNQAYTQQPIVNSPMQPSFIMNFPSTQQPFLTSYTPPMIVPLPQLASIQPQMVAAYPFQPSEFTQMNQIQQEGYSSPWSQYYPNMGMNVETRTSCCPYTTGCEGEQRM